MGIGMGTRLVALATSAVLSIGLFQINAGDASPQEHLSWSLTQNGSAIFFIEDHGQRKLLWTVTCRVPLRGCLARNNGLVLWVDDLGRPWLRTMYSMPARVSFRWKNQISDIPRLIEDPLSSELQKKLSLPGTELVIEEAGFPVAIHQTTGTQSVIQYLSWLSSDEARVIRDATFWSGDNEIDPSQLPPPALERFQILQARRSDEPQYLIPVNKPQIEFAVRSQGGTSFHSTE